MIMKTRHLCNRSNFMWSKLVQLCFAAGDDASIVLHHGDVGDIRPFNQSLESSKFNLQTSEGNPSYTYLEKSLFASAAVLVLKRFGLQCLIHRTILSLTACRRAAIMFSSDFAKKHFNLRTMKNPWTSFSIFTRSLKPPRRLMFLVVAAYWHNRTIHLSGAEPHIRRH